ncbi:hypothetical protein [Rhodococcus sp. X156]|uniref:hypothetical protein n=1 Tax=Rhodococcus sp. X156 TaxID=2499145 RepID=UPI000FD7E559|nr:hypothetical protein [Rhodococcus sp. X156]
MTDHEHHEPARDALATLLNNLPPRDVVGGGGLSREWLRTANANASAHQPMPVTVPGEVVCDADGLPIAVGPATTMTMFASRVTITRGEADALDVAAGELPHVRIVEPPHRADQQ